MPRQVFTAGEILTAANMNDLADASVMVFDSSAARGSAIPSPSEGMVTYLKDTDGVEKWTGAAWVNVDTGKILQVVSTTKTDTFTTSSTSFTGVTGLTASITPSSTTSKVLVFLDYSFSNGSNSDQVAAFRLVRDSTAIFVGGSDGNRTPGLNMVVTTANFNTAAQLVRQTATVLDTPSTTSSVSYSLQARIDPNLTAGSLFVNRASVDDNFSYRMRGASSITLMEVAG
jgi:hypothetical protein